jgi:hypothetical protein
MVDRSGLRWRAAIWLTIVIGTAAGLTVSILENAFGVSVPPILAGLLSAVIIMVAVFLSKGKS